MKETRFIFFRLCIYLISGVLLAFYYHIPRELLFTAVIIAVILYLLLFLRSQKQIFQDQLLPVLSFLMILLLGYTSTYFQLFENVPNHYSQLTSEENLILKAKVVEELKPTKFSKRYVLQTSKLISTQVSKPVSGKILLNVINDSISTEGMKPGAVVLLPWKFEEIRASINPFQFSYKNYLKNLQIEGQLSAERSRIKIVDQEFSLFAFAQEIRYKLITNLREHDFGTNEIAVFQALVLGEKRDIQPNLYKQYASAGAIHILAISGLHIGILLLFLNYLLKPLDKVTYGRIFKPILLILLLWMFALLTGFNPSVVRAVCMFSFIAVGMQLKRKTSTLNSLYLSLFFLLLLNPYYIFQVGFQLSYLAVLGILLLQPAIYKLLNFNWKVADYFWKIVSVSLAAQIGVLPLSVFYFHQFPGLFLVSNIVILPFLGILLGFGLLIILLSSLNFLPEIVVRIFNFSLELMNLFIASIGNLEIFIIKDISISKVQLFTFYVVLIAFILLLNKINFRKIQFLLITILCFQAATIFTKKGIPTHEALIFHSNTETVVTLKSADKLQVYNSADTLPILTDYLRERRIKKVEKIKLANEIQINNKIILIVDTSITFQKLKIQPDILFLRNAPKINLERLLECVQPKEVIADGSNFRSYTERWKQTALAKKIPFHYTGEKGAFLIFQEN